MTNAFEHFINRAHSLRPFRALPDTQRIPAMKRRLGTASNGERAVILAALSLLPSPWVDDLLGEDVVAQIPAFRLADVYPLDRNNTRALLEAIAVQTDHTEVLDLPL